MMAHNEPGREPMEPTDAELVTLLSIGEYLACWDPGVMVLGNIKARDAIAAINAGITAISGQRPLPDTPAPDEVSRLEREISYTELRSAASRLSRVNTDLREQLDDSMQQNTALTARVAELEAFVSRVVANHTRSTECLMCERLGEQGEDLLAPGKEPTSE